MKRQIHIPQSICHEALQVAVRLSMEVRSIDDFSLSLTSHVNRVVFEQTLQRLNFDRVLPTLPEDASAGIKFLDALPADQRASALLARLVDIEHARITAARTVILSAS